MKRREAVALQIRASLSNGGVIHGSTLTAWARDLDDAPSPVAGPKGQASRSQPVTGWRN